MYVCLYVCVCLKWSFVLFDKQTDNSIKYLVKNNIFDKEFENVLAYLNLCTQRSRLVVSSFFFLFFFLFFWGGGGWGWVGDQAMVDLPMFCRFISLVPG